MNAFDYEGVREVFGEIIEMVIERKAEVEIGKKHKE